MQDLAELERRISAALSRIGAGIDALPVAAASAGGVADQGAEVAALRAELEAERAARAELQARLDAMPAQPATADGGDLAERVERMTRQLDVQGIEMVRLRKTVGALRENLRALRTLQQQGIADPAAVNRAMAVELDSIRVQRLSEVAELDEILAELEPLVAAGGRA